MIVVGKKFDEVFSSSAQVGQQVVQVDPKKGGSVSSSDSSVVAPDPKTPGKFVAKNPGTAVVVITSEDQTTVNVVTVKAADKPKPAATPKTPDKEGGKGGGGGY